jgi:hypothetical protein
LIGRITMNEFYVLSFDSVFKNEKIKEAFYKHLEKEYNNQPYDFLMELNKLKELKVKLKLYKRNQKKS